MRPIRSRFPPLLDLTAVKRSWMSRHPEGAQRASWRVILRERSEARATEGSLSTPVRKKLGYHLSIRRGCRRCRAGGHVRGDVRRPLDAEDGGARARDPR